MKRVRDKEYFIAHIKDTIRGHYRNIFRYPNVHVDLDGVYVPTKETGSSFIFYDWSKFSNLELKMLLSKFCTFEGLELTTTNGQAPEHPVPGIGIRILWPFNGFYGFKEDGTRMPATPNETEIIGPSTLPRSARR